MHLATAALTTLALTPTPSPTAVTVDGPVVVATTVWDVLTAIGTVGAVIVAVAVTVLTERRIAADRRQQAKRAMRVQAEQVGLWVEESSKPSVRDVVVVNGSPLPIRNLSLDISDQAARAARGVLLPGATWRLPVLAEALDEAKLKLAFTDNQGHHALLQFDDYRLSVWRTIKAHRNALGRLVHDD